MNQRQVLEVCALVVAVLFGGLAIHNAGVNQQIVAAGSAPSAIDWAFLSGTSLASIGGVITAAVSFLTRWWKPSDLKAASTLDLLKAIAVVLSQMPVFRQMAEGFQKFGLPSTLRIEMQWPGMPPIAGGWELAQDQSLPAPEVKP